MAYSLSDCNEVLLGVPMSVSGDLVCVRCSGGSPPVPPTGGSGL